MNNDPRDDKNEIEIKLVFLIPLTIIVIGLIVLSFSGCSSKVAEPWGCECNCGNDRMKCNGTTMQINIKDL